MYIIIKSTNDLNSSLKCFFFPSKHIVVQEDLLELNNKKSWCPFSGYKKRRFWF